MGDCRRNCWTCVHDGGMGCRSTSPDADKWLGNIRATGANLEASDGCPGWAPKIVSEEHRKMREQIRAEFMELHRQTRERPFRVPDVLLTDIRLPLPGSSAEPVSVPRDTIPWPISRAEWQDVLTRLHDLERRVRAVEDPDGIDLGY